jgi:probable phosphoglycerate mutase
MTADGKTRPVRGAKNAPGLPFGEQESIARSGSRQVEGRERMRDSAQAHENEHAPAGRRAGGRTPSRAEQSGLSGEGPVLRAWVDGGARGNPGPAGYGAHIIGQDGETIADKSGFLGVATNNVAEYNGLIAALQTAVELRARSLEVFADSELMVKQMNGQYKVRNAGLAVLFAKAKALAAQLPRFRIAHVRREQNTDADRLANEAMDRGV